MAFFLRWAGLAAFCTAFGFAGSLGGLWAMNGELRGPQGQPGRDGASVQGPAGPPGPRGAAGRPIDLPVSVAELDNVLRNLMDAQRGLIERVGDLEGGSGGGPSGDCFPTPVVTDVQWNKYSEFAPLNVRKSVVCLPLG
jgi:hypothetical protein